jgi:pyruvate formate lyase activating enzyme
MKNAVSLRELLYQHTMPAAPELVRRDADQSVHCAACAHRCHIRPDKAGVCLMRFNREGELRVPAGYVSGLAIDPIEKKPFYHVLPGAEALSFGMLGCCFHCTFCQNWVTSQTLRDERAVAFPSHFVTPEQIVQAAVDHNLPLITSTYNEPLITSEWAVEVFRLASAEGILCGYVSNGHGTPEVLEFLRPHMELFNIDLKCFDADRYRELGGRFEGVTGTIRQAHAMGFWVEVVTLVIPGFNDSDDELRQMADFVASVSTGIPWHVTAFHPTYKMDGPSRTSPSTLARAYEHGRKAGLKFVYSGNLPALVGRTEDTSCPSCGATLVERCGFQASIRELKGDACSKCGTKVPGRFLSGRKGWTQGSGGPRALEV